MAESTKPSHDGNVARPGEVSIAETELKAGALGLTGVLMQNVTAIAPAIAAFFFTPAIVGFAGGHAPLAYLIGFLVVLALGTCLVQLAKYLPSAGGYFTYVSRALNPRLGFLTAWVYTFYLPCVIGPLCAYFGLILEGEFADNYGWTWFHWWMFVIVFVPAIAYLGHLGIALSIKAIVILGVLEFLIVLALGVSGLLNPGPGGFTVEPFTYGFNPGGLATASGFALAIVFTVQGLTGWEAAVPLAEETENPRRNIPRATMLSIILIGGLLILTIWGQIIGWGIDDLAALPGSSELPALVLAHRMWGPLWILALFAMFSSVLGVCIACQNVATRMWYGMGRTGVLPSAVGTVHPVRQTPTVALRIQFVISMSLGLIAGLWFGPTKVFLLTQGFMLVIAVIFVYSMANVGVIVYYWRDRRSEFNWIMHFIFPLGTTAILFYSLIKSFTPFPESPYNLAPFIVGGWLVIGIAVLVVLKLRGNESWLVKAGQIVNERPETDDELAHRPAI